MRKEYSSNENYAWAEEIQNCEVQEKTEKKEMEGIQEKK